MLLEQACDLLNLVLVQVREKRHMLEDFNNLSRRERDHRLCLLKNLKHAARRVIVSYERSRVYRACAPPRWPIRSPDLILANVGVWLESHNEQGFESCPLFPQPAPC